MNLYFPGRVVDDKLVLDDPKAYSALRHSLNGKRVEISLAEEPTLPEKERRHYFGFIVTRLAEHTGNTVEATHRGLAEQFLVKFDSAGNRYVESYTRLTDQERYAYHARCNAYLGEQGVPEPDPLPEVQVDRGEL